MIVSIQQIITISGGTLLIFNKKNTVKTYKNNYVKYDVIAENLYTN